MPDAPSRFRADPLPLEGAERARAGSLAFLIVAIYVALLVGCSLALRRPGVMSGGQELTYDRALFLSISAGTLTGFQQSIGFNDFRPDSIQGPAIVLLLTVAGSLMAMIVAGLAAVRILRLRYSDSQLATAAFTAELLAILAGAAALITGAAAGAPGGNPGAPGGRLGVADAIQHAACAFGNSGMLIGAHPRLASWHTQCILLPLSIMGGLGLPVLMELYDLLFTGAQPSIHTRRTLALAAGVYLAGVLLVFVALLPDISGGPGWRWAIGAASTAAVDSRTAGLPLDFVPALTRAAQWMVVALMMIGASPAGTGGGIKATTFYHLFAGVRDALRGRPVSRTAGVAAIWLAGYVFLAALGFLLLAMTQPQMPADRLIFLTISAISNVGLSHDPVSMVGPGLLLLAALMLAGRLAPIAIIWWMVRATPDAEVLVA